MNFVFQVTIKRVTNDERLGMRLLLDGSEDLEDVFQPKMVSRILKEYAKSLEINGDES